MTTIIDSDWTFPLFSPFFPVFHRSYPATIPFESNSSPRHFVPHVEQKGRWASIFEELHGYR
jgi:hypothetical protein